MELSMKEAEEWLGYAERHLTEAKQSLASYKAATSFEKRDVALRDFVIDVSSVGRAVTHLEQYTGAAYRERIAAQGD